MFLVLIFLLLLTVQIQQTLTQTCYLPNRDVVPADTPCRAPTPGQASACCNRIDICLDNGLCLPQGSSENVFYRGTCTDSTWRSDGCAKYCQDSECPLLLNLTLHYQPANGSRSFFSLLEAATDTGQLMWPLTTNDFCCGTGNSSSGTCDTPTGGSNKPFNVPNGLVINNRTSGSTGPNDTSSAPVITVTITAFPPTPSASSHSFTEAAVGAGVGVPLGLALLGALGLLAAQRRREKEWKGKVDAWEIKYEALARMREVKLRDDVGKGGWRIAELGAERREQIFEMGELREETETPRRYLNPEGQSF